MKPSSRAVRVGAAVAAGALAIGLGASVRFAGHNAPAGQQPLLSLDAHNLGQLRDAFNAGTGAPRVIAFLSPT